MEEKIIVQGIEIKILYKKIKNIHLKVTQDGEVTVSCPKKIPEQTVYDFINERMKWIVEATKKFESTTKYGNKKLENGEKHYLFGKELNFKIEEQKVKKAEIYIENDTNLIMKISPTVGQLTREKHLQNWYTEKLISETEKFFEKWEEELGVSKKELVIKKMKGKGGYCECRRRVICLNTELAKRKIEFVEYVVLHELCHLLVPNHGPEFKKLLNKNMPGWQKIKDTEQP